MRATDRYSQLPITLVQNSHGLTRTKQRLNVKAYEGVERLPHYIRIREGGCCPQGQLLNNFLSKTNLRVFIQHKTKIILISIQSKNPNGCMRTQINRCSNFNFNERFFSKALSMLSLELPL